MNKWKEFAKMLGIELDQEFVLAHDDGKRKNSFTYKITEDGILYRPPEYIKWSSISLVTLIEIINGDYKVVTKQWKPEKGDKYFYYAKAFGQTVYKIWVDENYDLLLWKSGNCFKTEEEAKIKGKKIMEQIQKEYDEA